MLLMLMAYSLALTEGGGVATTARSVCSHAATMDSTGAANGSSSSVHCTAGRQAVHSPYSRLT